VEQEMLTTNTKLRSLQGRIIDVSADLNAKATRVLTDLESSEHVMVAFSGGIDSTLIAYLAKLALGENTVAVTANSPSLPTIELQEARKLAGLMGVRHMVVDTEELDDPNYVSNPSNRCYFCKKELGEKLTYLARTLGEYVIVDGTNAEDLQGHRPGAAALSERDIRRPLADAGMTKEDVRELSKQLGLPNFDKPSMPCLSSRVQYGQIITPDKLHRIEQSEELIRSLTGVRELRVRDHGNLARIEVGHDERALFFNEELMDRIAAALKELGYVYVTVDLVGYRSGSMNQALQSTAMSDGKQR
jgi:uncharacterized protein